MIKSLKKWPVVLVAAILPVVIFFMWPRADFFQLAGVKEITLSPTDIAIPSVRSQTDRKYVAHTNRRYSFSQDGGQYHLEFFEKGTFETVIGDMPTFTADPKLSFRDFTDVVSPSGTTTYARYVKYKALPIEGAKLVASELYALNGNRARKVLSNVQPSGIETYIEKRTSPSGTYLDQRGYLYALTDDGTLCVIRDGQIIGKADVSKIGGMPSAAMFSDADDTYFLVRKFANASGPVGENDIQAKYKITF